VGAGPAGSSTAIHLARFGGDVLVAQKARFPRDKPCGGGFTGRGFRGVPGARFGVAVLVAEKARFPRDKPCGGGLTGRALKWIPVDPSPVVERDVDRFELRLRYGSSFTRSHDQPLIRMTQRRRLDAFLVEHAA